MRLAVIFVLSFFIAGCSLLKARPAERAGFIPSVLELKEERERRPFHGGWTNAFFLERKRDSQKLLILPVRTDYLLEKGWWSELNQADQSSYEEEVSELALFFYEELQSAFRNYQGNRWKLVEEPDEETLIVEYALVEVVATKAHINAIGTTLGFFVPGGGLINQTASGSIAFEGKIFDGRDGELLTAFADREADKLAVATLRDFQFYAHARESIREWSEQLAKLMNTSEDITVEDSAPITLSPF